MNLTGIHHLTAVSADIQGNYRFYTRTLGMRLVKRSVNQDDVSAYHLFYADAVGTPGTDLTFFDWQMAREQRGTNGVSRTHLRVNGGQALAWWEARFRELAVPMSGVRERDGRLVIDFEDPEGQRLALIDDGGTGTPPVAWAAGPVPAEFQIRGLGPLVLSVPVLAPTDALLTDALNMRRVREYTESGDSRSVVQVYEMGDGGPHAELHVAVQPHLPRSRLGAGGVHHLALRTPSIEQYHAWTARLNSLHIGNSGEVDRFYFRSLYFREPNGILFEIATDGPGFSVDEKSETLGQTIALPPFLEGRRASIMANLKSLE